MPRLIAGLRQIGVLETTDGSDPCSLSRLPFIEVLTANIRAIDDLIAITDDTEDLHAHGGLDHRCKAAGNRTELEPDISDILALNQAQRYRIEA